MIQLLIPLETKPNLYGKQHWNNNHLFGSHPQLRPRIWQRLFTSKVSHPKQLPIQWADATEEGGKPCQSTEKGCKEETSGDQKCRSLFTAAEEEDHRLSPPPWKPHLPPGPVFEQDQYNIHKWSLKRLFHLQPISDPKLDWSQVMSGLMLALPLISSVILGLSHYLSWRIFPEGKYTRQGE